MFRSLSRRTLVGAAAGLLLVAQIIQIASPLILTASAADVYPLTPPGLTPVTSVNICHANSSNNRPYGSATVSINSADPVAGHSGHTGPVWEPTLRGQRIDWGDIIPPFYYVHGGQILFYGGKNWDKDGQLFWQYGCDIANIPAAPSMVALSKQLCTPLSGGVDVVTVNVVNTNDVYDDAITYTVTIGGQTQTRSIADDSSYNFVFTGLAPGSYTATVAMVGDTHNQGISYTTSMNVTVGSCPAESEAIPPIPTTDPCGLGNISWNVTASGQTAEYLWAINDSNQLVYTAKAGYYFLVNNQRVYSVTYSLPADSGVLCSATLPIPPAPVDPCGSNNAYWAMPLPASTTTYSWELRTMADGVHLYAVASADYAFHDNEREHDFGLAPDSGAVCPSPALTRPTCTTPGSVTVADPKDGSSYYYTITLGVQTTRYATGEVAGGLLQGSTVVVKLYRVALSGDILMSITNYNIPLLACIAIPPTPTINDPCGVANAAWVIPDDTAEVTWELVHGELIATAHGSLFIGGQSAANYGLATDRNMLCMPTTPTIEPVCGLVPNDVISIPDIADQQSVHFYYRYEGVVENNDGTFSHVVKAVADDDYFFEDESTTITWNFNESTVPCKLPSVTWKLPTCLDQTQSVTVIYDTAKYLYTISKDGGEEVGLTSGTTSLATGSYTIHAYELWYLDEEMGPVYWLEPSYTESKTIVAANGCGGYVPTPPTILPTPIELPRTGSTASGMLAAVVAAIATYGAVYFTQGKRRYL